MYVNENSFRFDADTAVTTLTTTDDYNNLPV